MRPHTHRASTHLCKLLPAATEVIVTNSVEVSLLRLTVKGLSLSVDNLSFISNDQSPSFSNNTPCPKPQSVSSQRSAASEQAKGRTYTIRGGVNLDDLEVDGPHAATDLEDVTLADGAVRLQEVGLEVNIEEVAGKS